MIGAIEEVEAVLEIEQSLVDIFHLKLGFEEQGPTDTGPWVRMSP